MNDDQHGNGHGADGDHGHPHPKHELSPYAKRIYAIKELLIEKGVLTQEDVQREMRRDIKRILRRFPTLDEGRINHLASSMVEIARRPAAR